jgi:hypothetical protein
MSDDPREHMNREERRRYDKVNRLRPLRGQRHIFRVARQIIRRRKGEQ